MQKSPILVLDDDQDDLEMISDAFQKIKVDQPVKCFQTGEKLIDFLKSASSAPFLIISDVNMPGNNGFEVKERIGQDKELAWKSVPYIYLTTSDSEDHIKKGYELQAQGFFAKPTSFGKLCDRLQTIVDYWTENSHPEAFR